jgi:large subunit ribosomal protein L29
MTKAAELRNLSLDELRSRLNDAREELMRLRFQQATGELTDTTRLGHTRREIARLSTLITERLTTEQVSDTEGGK